MGALQAAMPDALAAAVAKRRAEYLAGRLCAMQALGAAGYPATAPGRHREGAPFWPDGAVGSISHTGGLACAAVATERAFAGVGIDLEPVCGDGEAAEIAASIYAPGEREALGAWPGREAELLTIVFTAKEALYKCVWPTVRRFVDFEEAAVCRIAGAQVRVEPRGRLAAELGGCRLDVWSARYEGCRFAICTMIALDRKEIVKSAPR